MPASSASRWWRGTLRWLSWFHRWTGVLFCICFTVWFASGLVMVFVPYPSLSDQARRAAAQVPDLAQVQVRPGDAIRAAGGGQGLRLVAADGRNRYVSGASASGGGHLVAVDARSGALLAPLDVASAGRIASAFGKVPVQAVTGPFDYDQWVVHQKFDAWRPFFRADLADDAHTRLYISARTGEVMQRTTRWARGWNWIGSVPHWLYFTALRQSFRAWDWTMWSLALVALAGAGVGTYLGIYRSYQRVKQKRPGWTPFKGIWRWHHGLGLGAAPFVLMWIFSGWLSMDHGRLFSRGIPDQAHLARYQGASLPEILAGVPASFLTGLQGASEITFSPVGSKLVIAGYDGAGTRIAFADRTGGQRLASAVPEQLVTEAVRGVWPQAVMQSQGDDALYRAADGLAGDAMRFRLTPAGSQELYVDRATGNILLEEDASRRAYAWSYFALHTTHLPGLSDHPALRRSVQVALLLLGLAFSITGMWMGFQRLRISMPGTALK